MDSPKYQKSDPAILLLNEIDILLAQTRLMELYLKQAQATAANENARLHEQFESELATLRADLADSERQLQQRPVGTIDRDLSATVDQLQRELSEKQQILSSQEVAFQRSTSEIAALQGRISLLEADNGAAVSAARASNAIREVLAADVAALNQELERNRRELHRQQLAARELESGLREQLQLLQNQVADKQAYAFSAGDELGKAQQEIAALHQHLGSLQARQDELQSNAAREFEQARGRFESELASLRSALGERDRSVLHSQAALVEIERGLSSEIATLRNEIEQSQAALGLRDDDLRAAGAQIGALQQRVSELELAHRQATDASAEMATLRRSWAEEVANLQHEVEVKEKELTHRYQAVTAVELALHGRIQALQQELARAREASDAQEVELESQRAETLALQGRIADLERSQADSSEIEAARRELQGELNRQRADLAHKEHLLAERERAIAEIEARLGGEIVTLNQQLEQERSAAGQHYNEALQARGELAASREQLEGQLKQKDDELASLRASAAGQAEQLSNRIDELQLQLAEKQLLVESRATALDDLRASVTQLHEQLIENDRNHAQALELWQDSQARYGAELAQLTTTRDELLRGQTALEVDLDQAHSANAGLRGELEQSRNRAAELDALLESSQAAMAGVAADRARLGRELETLDGLHNQTKADAARELDQGRAASASELSVLRNELQQKAWSLAQHQASVENLAQVHREQMRKLEARLSEQHPVMEQQSRELEQTVSRANALRRQVEELRTTLQQAQAGGASQAEQIRQEYAGRLETVNSLLAIKSAEMANSGAVRANVEESLRGELSGLRSEMQARAVALQSREDELNRVRAEMTALQDRLLQLESHSARSENAAREIGQAKNSLESDLVALRHELQQRSSATAQQQAAMDELAARQRGQVEQLEANLSEQQSASAERHREVDRAQAQIALLHGRIEELQGALQQSESTASSEAEELRRDFEARIAALKRDLGEHSAQLQDRASASSDTERTLRDEIDRLTGEAQERNQILESRNDELVRVKTDLDSLAERFGQLQSRASQAETSASDNAESMRSEFQAQLALLQAELSQKEWALEERQAIVAGLEQQHRQQLEALPQRLGERAQSAVPSDDGFVIGDPNLTETQRDKLDKLDDMVNAIGAGDDASIPVASGRRWHSGFGWKRRWRS